jgi:hypothetical protein
MDKDVRKLGDDLSDSHCGTWTLAEGQGRSTSVWQGYGVLRRRAGRDGAGVSVSRLSLLIPVDEYLLSFGVSSARD